MNTATATAAVMSQTSTAVLIEAAQKLMAVASPAEHESRVLAWTLGELFDRCPELRATIEAAL